MSLIEEITFINQNMQIPSAVAADIRAREVENIEFKQILSKEKERKVEGVNSIEGVKKILPINDEKTNDEMKHIDEYA